MEIRRATPNDLDDMLRIYAVARQFMKTSKNPDQWGDTWPPFWVVEQYTRANGYVVLENGKIIAAFGLYENADDTSYRTIDGKWLNDKPYAVIHTLASDGTTKGVAHFVFEWAVEKCGNVRIDTHEKNTPMIKVLERDGWTYCGIIHIAEKDFDGDTKRVAYQKVKNQLF